MSRIGNAPIAIPKGVKIKTEGQTIAVEGPKGKLSFDVPEPITLRGRRRSDQLQAARTMTGKIRALHGMARAMTNNMVVGCSRASSGPSRSSASVIAPPSRVATSI